MRYGIRQPLCLAPSCSLLRGFWWIHADGQDTEKQGYLRASGHAEGAPCLCLCAGAFAGLHALWGSVCS